MQCSAVHCRVQIERERERAFSFFLLISFAICQSVHLKWICVRLFILMPDIGTAKCMDAFMQSWTNVYTPTLVYLLTTVTNSYFFFLFSYFKK